MWLRCTAKVLRLERLLRSGAKAPERVLSARFMLVTRLELSHVMPSHWQKSVFVDHDDGVFFKDVERAVMAAPSSAVTAAAAVRSIKVRHPRMVW